MGESWDRPLEFSLTGSSTGSLESDFSAEVRIGPPSPSSRVASVSCFLWAGGLPPETLKLSVQKIVAHFEN